MISERSSINISGGTFQGSAVGIGHVEQHGATVDNRSGLTELRGAFARHADEIIASGRDDEERADLRHELRKIEKELYAGRPDGPAVVTRWKSVLSVLNGVVAAGTTITGITELIEKVFSG